MNLTIGEGMASARVLSVVLSDDAPYLLLALLGLRLPVRGGVMLVAKADRPMGVVPSYWLACSLVVLCSSLSFLLHGGGLLVCVGRGLWLVCLWCSFNVALWGFQVDLEVNFRVLALATAATDFLRQVVYVTA
eukprot:Gb_16824 [translate_table: standard]